MYSGLLLPHCSSFSEYSLYSRYKDSVQINRATGQEFRRLEFMARHHLTVSGVFKYVPQPLWASVPYWTRTLQKTLNSNLRFMDSRSFPVLPLTYLFFKWNLCHLIQHFNCDCFKATHWIQNCPSFVCFTLHRFFSYLVCKHFVLIQARGLSLY